MLEMNQSIMFNFPVTTSQRYFNQQHYPNPQSNLNQQHLSPVSFSFSHGPQQHSTFQNTRCNPYCSNTRQSHFTPEILGNSSLNRERNQPINIPPFLPAFFSFENCFYEEEADWFDIGDDEVIFEGYFRDGKKLDHYPVPTEPVAPIESLTIALMDDHEFYCNQQDYIQVYTDGSFRYSLDYSFSAIGVWFGPNHKLNVSQSSRLGGFNSDGAELEAIIEAIKIVCSCGVEKVQINTDSQNAVRFLTHFIRKWEANGWRNRKGLPVRNQNLIRLLDHYTHLVTVKWNYVPSCAGVRGNMEADRLAKTASAAEKKSKESLYSKRASDQSSRNNRRTRRFKPY